MDIFIYYQKHKQKSITTSFLLVKNLNKQKQLNKNFDRKKRFHFNYYASFFS